MAALSWYSRHAAIFPSRTRNTPMNGALARCPVVVTVPVSSYGAVRGDVHIAEVMALITSSCHGALHGGWDSELQHRTLAVIFDGLRPAAGGQ
jgi:hypothetical protein